eukprot:TRINITY_DN5393_c0_g1_i1.p1 TRINITY_DN5393_c0_g1~~TRINITY_DN5393_c0_g1_i1.p1  ORF type:complete len:354 (-),score=46.03 TRINITY_DN5393_c0_g1_i1:53-1114(-)
MLPSLLFLLLNISLVLCVVDVDVNNRLAFELSADPTSPNGPVPKSFLESEVRQSIQQALDFADVSFTAKTVATETVLIVDDTESDVTYSFERAVGSGSLATVGTTVIGPGQTSIPNVCEESFVKVCTELYGMPVCRKRTKVDPVLALEGTGNYAHASYIPTLTWPANEVYTVQSRMYIPSGFASFHFFSTSPVSNPDFYKSIFRMYPPHLNMYQDAGNSGNMLATVPVDQWMDVSLVANGTHYQLYIDNALQAEMEVTRKSASGEYIAAFGDHRTPSGGFSGNVFQTGGKIQRVRVLSKALSESELLANPPHHGTELPSSLASTVLLDADFSLQKTYDNDLEMIQTMTASPVC